jgi:organic hydroperoxide reductase OsmC/OhrA
MSNQAHVQLTRRDAYQFDIQFSPDSASLLADEPPPLGSGAGPTPAQLLIAAVANCMSSSLIFALSKFHNDAGRLRTSARATIGRNEAGRLRVLAIELEITVGVPADTLQHLDRILGQFEEFCTVGQSVRVGIPVSVTVRDVDGLTLKSPQD